MQSPAAEAEGQLVLDDGSFQMDLVRECANPHAAVELLQVAVVRTDVDDAGDAAAVAGGEAALVEGNLFHGLRLEDGEYTHQVLGVVERDAVEQQQVLFGTAASHIDAAESFGAALHSRHQLNRLQHVVLAEQHRGMLNHLHRQLDGAHLRALDAGVFAGHHRRLFQRRTWHQRHV